MTRRVESSLLCAVLCQVAVARRVDRRRRVVLTVAVRGPSILRRWHAACSFASALDGPRATPQGKDVACPSACHRHRRAALPGTKIEEGFASAFDGGVRSPFHDQPLGFSLEKFKMTPAEL